MLGPKDICYSYLQELIDNDHPLMLAVTEGTKGGDATVTMSLLHLIPLVVNLIETSMGYASPQANRLTMLAEILWNDPQLVADLHERIQKIEAGLEPK